MATCNNSIAIFDCTLETCCFEQGFVEYQPQLAATAAYLAIFALFLFFQVGLGIYGRTWGFMVGMVCGLFLEILGYAGRLAIRQNPFNLSIFLFYFIPLGLGPAFLTASIYLTLGRLVIIYGEQFSRLKPRTYTFGFLSVDVLSLIIQAVGGGICGAADTDAFRQQGVYILIAGLSLQACSLLIFLSLCTEYGLRVRKNAIEERNPAFRELREMPRFKWFLRAITLASITIFIRCIYRVIELAQGFSGTIANAEIPFLILEGPMIMVAVLALTVFHPSVVFRNGSWKQSQWRGRNKRLALEQENALGMSVGEQHDAIVNKKSRTWWGARRVKSQNSRGMEKERDLSSASESDRTIVADEERSKQEVAL